MKKLLSFLVLFNFYSIFANAQWQQTNGPYGGEIQALAVSGSNIFAGTHGGGVFLSGNNGSSWTAVYNGLTSQNILSLTVSGSNIFAGTANDGVFLQVTIGQQ